MADDCEQVLLIRGGPLRDRAGALLCGETPRGILCLFSCCEIARDLAEAA